MVVLKIASRPASWPEAVNALDGQLRDWKRQGIRQFWVVCEKGGLKEEVRKNLGNGGPLGIHLEFDLPKGNIEDWVLVEVDWKRQPEKSQTKERVLFLDRDGVVNVAPPRGKYVLKSEELILAPGIESLLQKAKVLGYRTVVVTNQGQIALGLLEEWRLKQMHMELRVRLGNLVDAIYYCPHHNQDGCDCRKPQPGMLMRAGLEFEANFAKSWMIGDSDRDVVAAQRAGVRSIFIRNAYNEGELKQCLPDHVIDALPEAEKLI